ncbi:bifunctional folylpolyglutamate synthase/dihydrofolate synthase [Halalkalibaculum sp. DA3122]|uniref:bifunctional folylpolyglutamate synthase/dihydrofolate synthase n=1 Tax=unclassified Halalkalibaculum TaxID=2964617 RepID=UPI0037550C70
MKLNSTDDLYRYLDSIPAFQHEGAAAAKLDLERFRAFCGEIGDPQESYPSIHVAGTNGKGSTCQILGAIYHNAGYKTGVYTSPHLLEYRERFQVDGEYIPEERLLEFINTYRARIEAAALSYFELSTAIAFWWFHVQQVDIAVIETGLGGRLDATNILRPEVSVITNVSRDHTDILGEDILDIAKEKAGIIKFHTPVVVGNASEEVRTLIRKEAARQWGAVYEVHSLNPTWKMGICTLAEGEHQYHFATDLNNSVQAYNIAAAWYVVKLLGDSFNISEDQFREGLKQVKSTFNLPGRFEKLDPGKEWYFDGAHNLEAVRAMTASVERIKPLNRAVLVLSLMKDKIDREMMAEFQKFKKIYYYTSGSKRSAGMGEIKKWLPDAEPFPDEQPLFLKELESELVIFAGSFYFYSSVRKLLQTLHSDQ